MNSPKNKQIFVGIFSYKLILDVVLQNYRRTIWNGGQYGMAYPFLIVRPCHIVPPLNCVSLWINLTSACVVWSNSTQSWVQEDMEKVYRVHSRCRPIPYCPKRYLGTACLDMTFHPLYEEKLSVLYMNSPRNKQIFVGNFSYKLIMDVILQNYRGTIWNGGTIWYGLPISYCPPVPYCLTSKLCKFVINLTSACVVWSKSTQSEVQEDMEKVYRAHSRCRPIPYCPKRYLGTACLDMTFASVVWRKTIGIVHE